MYLSLTNRKALFVLTLGILTTWSGGHDLPAQTGQNSSDAPSPQKFINHEQSAPATDERWDQLPLDGNGLKQAAPLEGEKGTFDGYTRELLRVQWRRGDPIDLYVIKPIGVSHPPVVLFLYGYPADSDRFRNDSLCKSLTKSGFAAVGFASALTGQRYHDRPFKKWFVSELQESIGASVHDVQMVLSYLASREDLDMNHVGMFGQGSGGAIAILTGAVDPRIKAVDVLDPWGDWPEWLAKSPQVPDKERSEYLKPDFLKTISAIDPIDWLSKYGEKPLRIQEPLFIAPSLDPVRQRFKANLPPKGRIVEYKNEQDYVQRASGNAQMLDWLHVQLTAIVVPDTDPSSTTTHLAAPIDSTVRGLANSITQLTAKPME